MAPHNNSAKFSLRVFQRWHRGFSRGESLLLSGVSVAGLLAILSSGAVAQLAEPVTEAAPMEAAPVPMEAPVNPVPDVAPLDLPVDLPVIAPAPMDAPPSAASTAPVPSDNSYIDSTNYSLGATERSTDRPLERNPGIAGQPQAPGIPTTVQVGPIAVSNSGSFGFGRTTPSVRDYYNRTIRPPSRLGNGNIKLIFPLSIPAPISSVFGWRIHPVSGDQRFHSGTDLAAPLGTPVLAAYAGQVALADFLGGYGLTVALDHNKGTQQTLYAHLSEIFVKPGETVQQGMVIGRVGSTGLSTGPHLHFEFRQLSPEGWAVMDAGTQLEYALAQLVRSMNFAGAKPEELGMQGEGTLGVVNLGVRGSAKVSLLPTALSVVSTPEKTPDNSPEDTLKIRRGAGAE